MSTAPISRQQIGAIHASKATAGLDDDTYRDVLKRLTGKTSSKQLDDNGAGRVLDYLRGLPSRPDAPLKDLSKPLAKGAVRLTGPYASKLRALWISGHNLGVVEDRSDKALLAFVERQTGISHTRWLNDPKDAAKAVEGLKIWLAREAGVDWPKRGAKLHELQEATYHALRRRLTQLGVTSFMPADTSRFTTVQFTEWMRTSGAQLRKALKAVQK